MRFIRCVLVDVSDDWLTLDGKTCIDHDKPLLIHAGVSPASPGLKVDPHLLCGADRVRRVLEEFPKLRICVPHMGADEFFEFQEVVVAFLL